MFETVQERMAIAELYRIFMEEMAATEEYRKTAPRDAQLSIAGLTIDAAETLKPIIEQLNAMAHRNGKTTTWRVESANKRGTTYVVSFTPSTNIWTCTCPDFVNRRAGTGQTCKHIDKIAVRSGVG